MKKKSESKESDPKFVPFPRSEPLPLQAASGADGEDALGVLVVEDNSDIREMLERLVSSMGYHTYNAATGKEALTQLRLHAPDIVFLDLMMPEMDGFEFCRAVQADPALATPHIIITSARDALEDRVKGLELGAADYVTKPFDFTELKARIRAGERIVRYQKRLEEQQVLNETRLEAERSVTAHQIVRSIEFPPEYSQAGIAILTYFGQVLRDKHPDIEANVKIEQDGFTVRLIIEPPEGERQEIEKTLTDYGLVVAGQLSPEQFLDDKLQAMRLRNKLEITALELRQTKELLAYTRDTNQQRIGFLEQQVQELFVVIKDGIQARNQGHEILKELIARFDTNSAIHEALQMLAEKLDHGANAKDEELVRQALTVIHKEKPSLLRELYSLLQGTVSGVTGNAAYAWIIAFINSLPK